MGVTSRIAGSRHEDRTLVGLSRLLTLVGVLLATLATATLDCHARTLVVSASGHASRGTYASVQGALQEAQPGDVVLVQQGIHEGQVRSVRSGTRRAPITLRGVGPRDGVVLTAPGNVLRLDHAYHVIEHLVLDGQYGPGRTVDIGDGAAGATLHAVDVRRSGRDCVRIRATPDVVVEQSLIHHCLNPRGGRRDAHGIVAGATQRLTIRDSDIHTFSGDGIQLDPDRAAPGWTDLVIEGCRIWLEPLTTSENTFQVGTVPGENAVDTKTWPGGRRASLTIRDSTMWGFRDGPIPNMAALNLKEQVDVTVDRVTIHDSEIAFRVRGAGRRGPGARVAITNAVIHDVEVAVRHEDGIEQISFWNGTLGLSVGRAFVAARSPVDRPDVRNTLVVDTALPDVMRSPSNLAVAREVFLDAAAHDYRLRPDALAIDNGASLDTVDHDRDGRRRPQGPGYDIGAYEAAWAPGGEETSAHDPPSR